MIRSTHYYPVASVVLREEPVQPVQIQSTGDRTVVSGTEADDSISAADSNYCTIYSHGGNDTIYAGTHSHINAYGGGNDYIWTKENSYVYGGSGNDEIQLTGSNSTAYGGDGDDYIHIWAYDNPGDGYKTAYNVFITGDDGDDNLEMVDCENSSANGYSGNDVLLIVDCNNSSLRGGLGDDNINVGGGKNNIVEAGAGNDLVSFVVSYDMWTSGDSMNATVNLGAGNDSIYFDHFEDPLHELDKSTFSILDLSNEDRLIFFNAHGVKFFYQRQGIGYVLNDNYGKIQLTLPNVTDLSQIEDVKIYNLDEDAADPEAEEQPQLISTLGDIIFDASSGLSYKSMKAQSENSTSSAGNTYITNNTNVTNVTNISNTYIDNSVTNNITNITNNTTSYTSVTNNFVSFSGSNNQTIENFVTGRNSNSNVLFFSTGLSSFSRSSSSMTFNAKDGSSLLLNNSSSVDEAIQYTTDGTNISYAKVGRTNESNSFTYEDGVTFYKGSNSTDVLNVTSYEGKNIWLNGSQGVRYSGINNIDASTSTGNNTLAGDSNSNQITAGSGNDSLWGGSGSSADTLIGGSGEDTFFFGKNSGADVINNASSNDTVNLYGVSLSDISGVSYSSNQIVANFKTGSSLTINNTDGLSSAFKLGGSKFQYNFGTSKWQRA